VSTRNIPRRTWKALDRATSAFREGATDRFERERLRSRGRGSQEDKRDDAETMTREMGKLFRPRELLFVGEFPTTQSSKTIRWVVQATYTGAVGRSFKRPASEDRTYVRDGRYYASVRGTGCRGPPGRPPGAHRGRDGTGGVHAEYLPRSGLSSVALPGVFDFTTTRSSTTPNSNARKWR